jgi:transposase
MPALHKNAKLYPLDPPDPPPAPPAPSGRSARKAKRGKARRPAKDPTAGLSVLNPNAAGIDVGASEHWVSIPPERAGRTTRCFGCTTVELQQLVAWLQEQRIDTVVLEATGYYWVVLYDLLEGARLRPVLVNPRYAKNMTGRKGDLSDSQWMQKLHTYGLFTDSFRPTEPIRVLRAYLRQRENLVIAASQSIQHMHKALVEMNVQLGQVISDISGETGLRIIDAILAGQREPSVLARLKDPRIRAGLSQLAAALQGHWKDEQLFILEQARLSLAHYQEQIAQCDGRIQAQMRVLQSKEPSPAPEPVAPAQSARASTAAPGAGTPGPKRRNSPPPQAQGQPAFDLSAQLRRIVGVDLTQIDGIGPITAQILISEIGTDASRWPSEKHFASWLGLCPDHRISGGKILSRRTRPVENRARHALRLAASSLERSQSALGAKYRRLKARLGAPKAIVAMAHQLARLIWRLMSYGKDYVDQGGAKYEAKYRAQRIVWLQKQAAEMNLQLLPCKTVDP